MRSRSRRFILNWVIVGRCDVVWNSFFPALANRETELPEMYCLVCCLRRLFWTRAVRWVISVWYAKQNKSRDLGKQRYKRSATLTRKICIGGKHAGIYRGWKPKRVTESDLLSERLNKQQRSDDDGEGADEFSGPCRNKAAIRPVEEFQGQSAKSYNDAEKVEASIVWLARAEVCIAAVVKCSTWREGWGAQRKKLYGGPRETCWKWP